MGLIVRIPKNKQASNRKYKKIECFSISKN